MGKRCAKEGCHAWAVRGRKLCAAHRPSDKERPEAKRSGRRGQGFYASALREAEQFKLPEAQQLEGLDEEIAVLRVRLHTALAEHPEDMDLLLEGMGMLVKAVAAKYRLSKKSEQDLMASVVSVLEGVGAALGLPQG